MDTKPLIDAVFLSASVPDPKRDPKYFDTADVIAIRDAVCALTQVVLPVTTLIWGGHPAITPIIKVVSESMKIERGRVVLYQSKLFAGQMPEDNNAFEHIIYTENIEGNRDKSLYEMRHRMMTENKFYAGIFIGGMEGIEDEFKMFREFCPGAKRFPVATT